MKVDYFAPNKNNDNAESSVNTDSNEDSHMSSSGDENSNQSLLAGILYLSGL